MTPWQVLRASRASQAALGYRVHHGAGVLMHYSAAPAGPAAPDSIRSFCLSGEKRSLQQLNGRLAAYLHQVQILEADNQRLEQQIQVELDRKCPRQLRELDKHLRTVSLLQDQISECLSAQAEVKLQLLEEELIVYELNIKCEKERERCGDLEAELRDLRLIGEELNVCTLPELQSLLNELTRQKVELQIQHQQEMQVLQVQVSGGVTVEMQTAESSDLVKELGHLRQTSVTLIDMNQNESRFNSRVMAYNPLVGSRVDQAELEELRRTATSLTEELKQLQSLVVELDVSGQEKTETFVVQLVFLQQTVDSLCRDLDSVMQAAAQQTMDHQALLDVKSRLEAEIQGYRRLLDGLGHQGVSDLASTSACAATSPHVFRANITSDKAFRVQSENVRTVEVQKVSRGHVNTVGQTQLSQTVIPIPSINASDNVHASKLQNSLIVEDEISQELEEKSAVKVSTVEIIHTQFPDSKPETSKLVNSLDDEAGTNIQVDITEITTYAEPEVKQGSHFVKREITCEPSKPSAADKETGTVNLGQMDRTEDSVHAKTENPAQTMCSETIS
ncbi:keratin, type I cytoskeletal 19-like [Mugil cephalus]|uniref:keratin, type I cytoskeletal 19-like n=1 Tax=Mugil cephalus TaxID=48193 RepID=UPI001FB5EDDE|nr:keratin, type I cytoskeletal 19-like [Mugil cephalus]